jgi:glyoxylase-like metal-dependent hydrolase (beta-lactamase superfamily II)
VPEILSHTSLVLGDVRLDLLDEGSLRLDGGAMFRVLPRALWTRLAPPDDRNRILCAMRPLLVRTAGQAILIETGIGPRCRDARFNAMYGVTAGAGIESGLEDLGLTPEQVDRVVLTHMHFDHGGGVLVPGEEGPRLRFPNARVVVQRREWEDSREGCPLSRASYLEDDYAPIEAAGRFELVDGDVELAPGLHLQVVGGHTRAHQMARIESGGETVVFWGDLIPTAAHLRPHYVMAYDLYPRRTWEVKERLVSRAVEEGWICVFYHEPETPLGRVVPEGRGYRVEPLG